MNYLKHLVTSGVAGICLGVALCLDARADDLWLSATAFSHHQDRNAGYNERNFGLGLDYQIDRTWRIGGGYYRNSQYNTTLYLGGMYLPLHLGDHVSTGLFAAGATGYDWGHTISPIGALAVAVEDKRVGADFLWLPRGWSVRFRVAF